MDIYIVRKCRVETKEFNGSSGAKYTLPVMVEDAVYSYVVREALSAEQRENFQKDLEDFYCKGGGLK